MLSKSKPSLRRRIVSRADFGMNYIFSKCLEQSNLSRQLRDFFLFRTRWSQKGMYLLFCFTFELKSFNGITGIFAVSYKEYMILSRLLQRILNFVYHLGINALQLTLTVFQKNLRVCSFETREHSMIFIMSEFRGP